MLNSQQPIAESIDQRGRSVYIYILGVITPESTENASNRHRKRRED
jgi:hypothetical protein